MALYPTPHSPDWFEALGKFNPRQAAQTKQITTLAGSLEVCGVCGDDPTTDYEVLADNIPADAVATIRLCDDCVGIRRSAGENFKPL